MLVSNSQQKEAVTVSLFNELKRRNVFRVAIAYLAVSWLLIQIVETIFPLFGLSDALIRLVIILSAIGFPLVVVFSWIFELTPDGLKLDKDVDHSSEQAHHTGKKFDRGAAGWSLGSELSYWIVLPLITLWGLWGLLYITREARQR